MRKIHTLQKCTDHYQRPTPCKMIRGGCKKMTCTLNDVFFFFCTSTFVSIFLNQYLYFYLKENSGIFNSGLYIYKLPGINDSY